MNYICQCVTPRVSSRFIGKVIAPAGGLSAGSIIVADTISSGILGNYSVYNATTPDSSNLGSNFMALVVNDGFETLLDGRRPEGNPNYYSYTFKEGEVATVIFLEKHLFFNIGLDCISSSTKTLATVGNYLVPVANSTQLSAVSTVPANVSGALKIVSLHNTPTGGNYGGGMAPSVICMCEKYDDIDTGAFLYSFTIPNQIGDTIIDQRNGTITVYYNGTKTSLVASFSTSQGCEVKVGDAVQVSGTTANDFSSSVTYKVTSGNGTSKNYVVSVLSTYTLSLSSASASITVEDSHGNILTNGATIIQGDVLTISAAGSVDTTGVVLKVNGNDFVSGNTLTVSGNVSVSAVGTFSLSITSTGATTTVTNQNEQELSDGATLLATDTIKVAAEPVSPNTSVVITVNGTEVLTESTFNVTENMVIVVEGRE